VLNITTLHSLVGGVATHWFKLHGKIFEILNTVQNAIGKNYSLRGKKHVCVRNYA